MYKTTLVKHYHNTDGQNNTSETRSQYRWTKTTPVKHDHNTDVQNNTRET
jgi:hypothetical protein